MILSPQGDTNKNVASKLKNILEIGIFTFTLSSEEASATDILLVYKTSQPPQLNQQLNTGTSPEKERRHSEMTTTPVIEQRWSGKHIADFVRKLGFLDTEGVVSQEQKELGEHITRFCHLNLVS